MKRIMTTMLLMMTIVVTTGAMSYSKARSQALFLTDKMGYELNLTDDQYDAAYEINLDYLMSIYTPADLYGVYWDRRNYELQYVLSAYQYQRFLATEYFYRPVTWVSKSFSFTIYTHYAKNRYFRNAPRVYDTYKGGNRQYQYSPYQGRKYAGEPNRNIDHKPATPGKTKGEAIKGGRQQQQNNSTWRQTQGNNGKPQGNSGSPQGSNKPQGSTKPQGNNGSPQGTFGSGRR